MPRMPKSPKLHRSCRQSTVDKSNRTLKSLAQSPPNAPFESSASQIGKLQKPHRPLQREYAFILQSEPTLLVAESTSTGGFEIEYCSPSPQDASPTWTSGM